MSLQTALQRVQEALGLYRECVEREAQEYGPEYERVTFMEYEAPAPDPCAEAFLRLVGAVRAYVEAGGQPEDLDLGEVREQVYQALGRA